MTDQSQVRFGIIGAGVAAETHARELARVGGARLEAVFARDNGKAERFRSAFDVPKAYSDLDRFLADTCIDAVIVATPNGLHRDYAMAVCAAGKHVIVEKPLEINTERAQAIVSACKRAGTRLFVIYQRRYSQAARKAKEDIAAGRLGKIVLVNIVDNEFRKPEYYQKDYWRGTKDLEGGGCIITQSTHLIDLVQYLAGPIASVFAYTRSRPRIRQSPFSSSRTALLEPCHPRPPLIRACAIWSRFAERKAASSSMANMTRSSFALRSMMMIQ
jgi:UDP-N-acetyl-2-amino-2-deoxyglucuronate dehydrogenase